MKKTGILGGTFNPIHIGHLILAEQARSQFSLDRVIFIPSGISYFKQGMDIPSGEIRLKMAELATRDNPCFSVSDIEIRRAGNTYTVDTLKELKEGDPEAEYYFIVGADIVHEIGSWRDPRGIFERCTILASVRNDETAEDLKPDIEKYEREYGARIEILHTTDIEISSSMIRDIVKEGGSVRYYVPEEVREFIVEKRLYG